MQQRQREQCQDMRGCRQWIEQAVDKGLQQAAHIALLRNSAPTSAMPTPAVRTPMRPAGQRVSRPNAMPAR